jgi:tetratricopeptide (TPR) repeat protein
LASYQSQRGLWEEKLAWAQEGLSACERLGSQTGWANMKIILGNAYSDLPTGDRAANLEKAMQCYQEALRVYTPEAAPFDYAMTQNNLGTAYRNLPTGDRAANLEKAIHCYQEALRVYTPEAAPFAYATTQNNLGIAYADLPTGDRAANLEKAMQCYQEALRFRTPEAAPFAYATTQNNLGTAYSALDRYQAAIDAYQKAIETAPTYAPSHNNLADQYLKIGRLDEAEAEFLEWIRLSPDDALYAEVSLGCIAFHKGEVDAAQDYFERALAIWDTARQRRLQSDSGLLENKALALLGVGRPQEAISTLHRALEQRSPTDTIDFYRYDLLATAPQPLPGLEEFVSLLRQAADE